MHRSALLVFEGKSYLLQEAAKRLTGAEQIRSFLPTEPASI